MVQFEEYYCFPADQVVCVKAVDDRDGYLLNVILKNGTDVWVTYKDKKQRDDAKRWLVTRIEREIERKFSNREPLLEKANLAQRSLDRLDRRQQKILKMLNANAIDPEKEKE